MARRVATAVVVLVALGFQRVLATIRGVGAGGVACQPPLITLYKHQ